MDSEWSDADERQSKARLTKINDDGSLGEVQYYLVRNGGIEMTMNEELDRKVEYFRNLPKTITVEFTDVDPQLIKLLMGEDNGTGNQDPTSGVRGQRSDEGCSGDRTSSGLLDGEESDDQDQ